jgi:hypothetical protein
MHEAACKASILLLSVNKAKRYRLLKKMDAARSAEIELAFDKLTSLGLTLDDFSRLKLPISVFSCESINEVNWLRSHASDKDHLQTKAKVKTAFLQLLALDKGLR